MSDLNVLEVDSWVLMISCVTSHILDLLFVFLISFRSSDVQRATIFNLKIFWIRGVWRFINLHWARVVFKADTPFNSQPVTYFFVKNANKKCWRKIFFYFGLNIQQAKPPGFRKLKLVMKVIIFRETGNESKNLPISWSNIQNLEKYS